LKNGEVIVSNGPFLSFQLKVENELFPIGSSCKTGTAELFFEFATSIEFGKITNISVFIGDDNTRKETEIENPENNGEIDLPVKGYIRMSLETQNGGVVFTNPVWVE
jgi:hypothetical protein